MTLIKLLQFQEKPLGTGGSRLGLSENDQITVQDLLYGLMLVSGNDAAVALAEFISGNLNDFSVLMNNKVSSLGLTSSHFVSPHGLDNNEHYTTALELAKIADYALENKIFKKIVGTKNCIISIDGHLKTLNNTNELLGYADGVYGVKTGFTNGANRCLVTCCKRNSFDIICVVLGCDTKKNRTLDSLNLINYTFDNFTQINIKNIISNDFENWKKENLSSFQIEKSMTSKIDLYVDTSTLLSDTIVLEKSKINEVSTHINYNRNFNSPLFKNTVVGMMNINVGDITIFSINILTQNTIERKTALYYLFYIAQNYFNYFL